MTDKQILYSLLEQYLDKKIGASSFCEKFTLIYNLETDYEELSKDEHKLFKSLCEVADRYTPFEEDFINYPNVYYNDKEIREKAEETARLLGLSKK